MLKAGVSNVSAFRKKLRRYMKSFTERYEAELEAGIRAIHAGVTSKTPVNSGQTLANYQWSVGSPATGIVPHDEGAEPGRTNEMALGEEPRRPANQAIADASLNSLPFGSLSGKRIYLTNNAPQFSGLENGLLPESPFVQRSPNGMVAITLTEVTSRTRLIRVTS